MTIRALCCGGGLVLWVTACGGTVVGNDPSPREQLQATSAERCRAACDNMVACGNLPVSCACGCTCPSNDPNCTCAPCDCGPPPTAAGCAADCNDSVNQILRDASHCEGQMLAVLNCYGSATCQPGARPCEAEANAMETCTKGASNNATTPPTAAVPGPGGVTCRGASGGGVGGGSTPPSPGETVCEIGWQNCSDGRSYSVTCAATSTSDLAYSCLVNGVQDAPTFVTGGCVEAASAANSACGWNLQ
jgi:hypothetical protein